MSIHLIPSTPAGTPDAAPLAALRHRRPLVLHEEPMTVIEHPAGFPFPALDRVPDHRLFVTRHGQSSRRVMSPTPGIDRSTMGATTGSITPLPRPIRAVVETLNTVTESGVNSSLPAPKAIVTVLRPWFTRQPANKERADLSVSIAVGSDGLITTGGSAYRALTFVQPIPLPGAGALVYRRGTPTSSIPRRLAGNINAPERITVSTMQRASEPQLIAEGIDNIIPFIRRQFEASDGINQEEQEALDGLNHYSDRALRHAEIFDFTASVTRIGFNKRNARRLRELFPELGPGAA